MESRETGTRGDLERALDLPLRRRIARRVRGATQLPARGRRGLPPPGPRDPSRPRPGPRPERGEPRRRVPPHLRGLRTPVAGGGPPAAAPGRAAPPGPGLPPAAGPPEPRAPARTGRSSSPSSSTTRAAHPGGPGRVGRLAAPPAPLDRADRRRWGTSPTATCARSSSGRRRRRGRGALRRIRAASGFLSGGQLLRPARPAAAVAAPDRPVLRRDGDRREQEIPPSTRTSVATTPAGAGPPSAPPQTR